MESEVKIDTKPLADKDLVMDSIRIEFADNGGATVHCHKKLKPAARRHRGSGLMTDYDAMSHTATFSTVKEAMDFATSKATGSKTAGSNAAPAPAD